MKKHDYVYGGGWGNSIEFSSMRSFTDANLNTDVLNVYGHKQIIPRVGQTMLMEDKNSFILFEFVEVDEVENPREMFFGKVKAIDREMK